MSMRQLVGKIKALYLSSFSNLSRDIWLLSLMTLINRSGTMVVVFMTIYLTEELNWTLTQAGIAMSIFGAGSVLGAFVGGWLTDRVGYYPTMFWSLLLGGFSYLLLMQVESFYTYCATVFLVSSINDCFRPANLASVSAYSKPENRNRSLSLIRLAINLGFALGVGVSGLIAEHLGFKFIFIIDTVTCVSAAIFLRLVLKEKQDQEAPIETTKEEVNAHSTSAYRDRLYLFFTFFILLNGITFAQLWNTVPVYYTDILDISKDHYGYIMLVNGILIVIFEMPIVYLFENRANRISLTLIGTAMIAFSFLIYNLTDFWQLAIGISVVMVSFGELIAFPFSNAFALGRSTPGRRGEYMGLYSMSWSIATIIAPVLGLWIAETYSFTTLWYVVAGIGLIATAGFFILKILLKKEAITQEKKEVLAAESVLVN